jgi:TldD protein
MLEQMKLTKEQLELLLVECLKTGADFSELFFERTTSRNMYLVSKNVQNNNENEWYGFGVRICLGSETAYAYSNKIDYDSILNLIKKLRTSFNENPKKDRVVLKENKIKNNNPVEMSFDSVSLEEKVKYMKIADSTVRGYSKLIKQVDCYIDEEQQEVLIVNSEGKYAKDIRNYLSFFVRPYAKKGIIKEDCFDRLRVNGGYELITEQKIIELSKSIAQKVVNILDAGYFKGGTVPVLIASGWGGVLIHEACGHSFESEPLIKNQTVFKDKLNKRVGRDILNIIDDGTMKNYWGSCNVDDEGDPCEKIILVKNGILREFLIDNRAGKELNMKSNACARRESYKYTPTARMHNTYVAPGRSTIEEMIESIDYGIYAKELSGGSVNPTTGEFNFGVTYGNVIRNGKICESVKNMSLIGTGVEVLENISMIGSYLEHSSGYCGSVSGNVPNCCGQPTIKIDKMIVGGREGGINNEL